MRRQSTVIRHQPSTISHQSSQSGMSLLEVILAIAVAGFVLAAAVSMLVSISSIWSERSERHFFVDHVDGVTEFLNATLSSSGVEIALNDNGDTGTDSDAKGDGADIQQPNISISTAGTAGTNSDASGGLIRAADEPVGWARPPGFSDNKEPLLNFKLTTAPTLLVGLENAPLLGLDAFLYFDDSEGLSLLWYSTLQEDAEDINDLRRTVISPMVTKIQYVYWDERFEKWETEDEPMEGDGDDQYLLPRFLILTFEYEGETQERTLTIPVPSKSALIY
jgi:prepilin-type N-terminal cleavage/methylation domain-containing protein